MNNCQKLLVRNHSKRTLKAGAGFANAYTKQGGAVLVIGLIIVGILAILGTAGLSTVTLEEKMARNIHNANKAFQGAEAALAECEVFVERSDIVVLTDEFTEDVDDISAGSHRVVTVGAFGGTEWWNDTDFWDSYGVVSEVSGLQKSEANPDGLVEDSRCVIEYVGNGKSSANAEDLYAGAGSTPGDKFVYRVTASSYGADKNSRAVVESIFVKM